MKNKFTRRRTARQLPGLRRKRKFQKGDQYLCYTDSGFLADILEYNGFMVHSLKRCDPNCRKFHLVVEARANEELFRERLEKNLARLNLVNFKP